MKRATLRSRALLLLVMAMFLLSIFSSSSCAARPYPVVLPISSPAKSRQGVIESAEEMGTEEACEGEDQEECLMRRTLVAHIDYIYTQKQKH